MKLLDSKAGSGKSARALGESVFATVIAFLTFFFTTISPLTARAGSGDSGLALGFEGSFLSSAHNLDSSKTTDAAFAEVWASLRVSKKLGLSLVAEYNFFQQTIQFDSNSSALLAHSAPFGGLRIAAGKGEAVSLTALYAPSMDAKYKRGSAPEEGWNGSAFLVKGSVRGQIHKWLWLTVSVNWLSASYELTSAQSVSGRSEFSRALILPTAGLIFVF